MTDRNERLRDFVEMMGRVAQTCVELTRINARVVAIVTGDDGSINWPADDSALLVEFQSADETIKRLGNIFKTYSLTGA